jgi:hypothetical protein
MTINESINYLWDAGFNLFTMAANHSSPAFLAGCLCGFIVFAAVKTQLHGRTYYA